ncbi:MAG: ATP synthase F1 subunit gamma [Tidjanibacter sp.]|nr:ATP synthase F1 subunit gamma [Tidjanibacter sp.]MBQ8272899.1 ATP synthase F1 subunit gamma [Tidjanibacter sp.]
MASLKEIKERIQSVRSTRKITSAMKMVAAAKLHRTQREASALVPYSEELQRIVAHLSAGTHEEVVALATEREVRGVTIVGFASNSTLCGAYNANVGREVAAARNTYSQLPPEGVRVVAMGKRLATELTKLGVTFEEGDGALSEHPNYPDFRQMAEGLMADFLDRRTDRVELVYYKFHSAGKQELVRERLLPIELPEGSAENFQDVDYILEPSREELIATLLPREVSLRLYTAALSAIASEHAARMVAMQAATDNADDLIGELSIEYNKQRQQAITTELLDIVGGQSR